MDVRLSDGEFRLFWPRDLEEFSPEAWWRFLLVGDASVNACSYSPECVEGVFSEFAESRSYARQGFLCKRSAVWPVLYKVIWEF